MCARVLLLRVLRTRHANEAWGPTFSMVDVKDAALKQALMRAEPARCGREDEKTGDWVSMPSATPTEPVPAFMVDRLRAARNQSVLAREWGQLVVYVPSVRGPRAGARRVFAFLRPCVCVCVLLCVSVSVCLCHHRQTKQTRQSTLSHARRTNDADALTTQHPHNRYALSARSYKGFGPFYPKDMQDWQQLEHAVQPLLAREGCVCVRLSTCACVCGVFVLRWSLSLSPHLSFCLCVCWTASSS
jgi:hypothetical protein